MSPEDLMSSEVLISHINMLSKVEKKKEKFLRRFHGTSNTVIHKIEYITTY